MSALMNEVRQEDFDVMRDDDIQDNYDDDEFIAAEEA